MPTCHNPECNQQAPEGSKYCGEPCLRKHIALRKPRSIEAVLRYIGIEKDNFSKHVAYRHWERFIRFIRDNSGENWDNFLRPRLRSYIGIDYRYINDYLDACIAWGIMKLVNGQLVFIGIPKQEGEQ